MCFSLLLEWSGSTKSYSHKQRSSACGTLVTWYIVCKVSVGLQRCGISDGLVRVACGIEATPDLIEDFELALASIGAKANALSLGSSNGPALGEVLQNVNGLDEAAQAVEESGLGKVLSEGLSGSPDVNVSQAKQNNKILQQI